MRVLVCGGRDFTNKAHLAAVMDSLNKNKGPIALIIEGGASGADALARLWAQSRAIAVAEFPANWKQLGRAAGPIRNSSMLALGEPDYVVAFKGGRGTANMVEQARKSGVETIVQ